MKRQPIAKVHAKMQAKMQSTVAPLYISVLAGVLKTTVHIQNHCHALVEHMPNSVMQSVMAVLHHWCCDMYPYKLQT